MFTPTLLCDAKCSLGESPLWDPRIDTFYWIDILGDALHCLPYSTSTTTTPTPTSFKLPPGTAPGFCALTSNPNVLLVGTKEGLFYFSWVSQTFSPSLLSSSQEAELLLKGTPSDGILFRFNDSQVCPTTGTLYAGIAQVDEVRLPGRGALFSLTPSKTVFDGNDVDTTTTTNSLPWKGLPSSIDSIHVVRPGTTVSNGFGWPTPNTSRSTSSSSSSLPPFVHIDSPTRSLAVVTRGSSSSEETPTPTTTTALIDTRPWGGYPDGMTMDVRNRAFVACIFGGVVAVTRPLTDLLILLPNKNKGALIDGGEVLAGRIELPVPLVTSCCIGGPKMDQLFMTTARGVTPETAAGNTCVSGEGGIFIANLGESVGVGSSLWGAHSSP
eukprot:GFYU01031849.1.p1 GENE.GFYU01031849.1~~GFYU01031849.1.p1  ORF type:complete len:383 (-),score=-28.13 GFYU01031849.1:16-1164(-)